ncbi:uncharacterized protein C1orf131 homolog [Apis laboriosa]|uniref:uncharacterized protein C1orf131 homolog n=1 Tax=Apis laboriosa TaxID=183418 RepID=UPI001CC3A4D3|nr:uncharacterized protein C1orf131 homolog [Apis laboriosa]XP_043795298.1 uncharacterized protein C1orf131 homolog [Apis laboriosa]
MEDFIPTRVSRIKKDAVKEFVSVNYEKPKKKKEIIKSKENNDIQNFKFNITKNEQNENNDEKKKKELEMKRIKYEVMKFGMSGFKGIEAEEAEIALAISLGAKPPKKKGINYKILKHERKQETQQKNLKFVSGLEKSLINHKIKKVHRKSSNNLLRMYGKINKKTLNKKIK